MGSRFTRQEVQMQVVLCARMRADGKSMRDTGDALGLNKTTVGKRLAEHDAPAGEKIVCRPVRTRVLKPAPVKIAPPDPMWTAARKLRLSKLRTKKWAISFIAEDLTRALPGVPVSPHHVVDFLRENRI